MSRFPKADERFVEQCEDVLGQADELSELLAVLEAHTGRAIRLARRYERLGRPIAAGALQLLERELAAEVPLEIRMGNVIQLGLRSARRRLEEAGFSELAFEHVEQAFRDAASDLIRSLHEQA